MTKQVDDRKMPAYIGLAKVAVQFFVETFVQVSTFVLRLNICGENSHLRQAAKRWQQVLKDTTTPNRRLNILKK